MLIRSSKNISVANIMALTHKVSEAFHIINEVKMKVK